ncbi:hypothetical protein [Myroides profundi]|uniref:Uncharacterized protein n=1 Tax=Myroides profundi TaxID=480520 RepID=A0AAJ5BEQ8_MYRPR|nr:hypothetical protein [Myroides profundi]AJH15242.1 hypothetical protein MPR_2071 [Myroides profundi]SER25049.1 hypothetical protein SAMN04488089_111129 [Myroides profundi]
MAKLTIFTKYGGGPIIPYESDISKILNDFGDKMVISPNIQLHIECRIDGDIIKYNDPLGCSNMRFMKKKNIIANTIAITYDFLKESNEETLKVFLKENFVLAISQMLDRLKKEKYILDKDSILNVLKKEFESINTK